MKPQGVSPVRPSQAVGRMVLLLALALPSLLAACGGPTPTPEIIVVTATYTPASVAGAGGSGADQTPTSESQAAGGQAASEGGPTVTLAPTRPRATEEPTVTAVPTQPSDTPPPTDTPKPSPTATSTAKPTPKPKVLSSSWLVVYTVCQPPRGTESYSLWQMRGDGSNPEQVIRLASEPAFSANGKRMVYYRWIEGLRVIFLDREPQQEMVSRGDGNASFPSMSPDGGQIVYHQIPPTRTGQFTIRICDVDGQNDRFVTPGSRPSWSPKGGLIAYDSCQNNQCGIFVIQPGGQGLRQLTTDVGHGPAWAPDGQRLAYATAEDGDFEIFVINLDGSGKRQLTKNQGNDVLPTWSPDGNFIYYRSDNNGKGWSIMVIGADGSNPRKLVDAPACDLWAFEKLAVTQ